MLYVKTNIFFFGHTSLNSSRNAKCFRQICRENQNAFYVQFFENCVVYEITWKNIVEPDRLQMKIWLMRNAWWTPKTTNKHTIRICNTYYFPTATMVGRKHHTVMMYVYEAMYVMHTLAFLLFLRTSLWEKPRAELF